MHQITAARVAHTRLYLRCLYDTHRQQSANEALFDAKVQKNDLFWQKMSKKQQKNAFFVENIWSIQKKAVPLHPLSEKSTYLQDIESDLLPL